MGQGGGTFQLLLLGGMIVVFWLFMIRPQAKKAKAAKQFQENLQNQQEHTKPSEELLKKQEQIQKLMDEMNDKEMEELMKSIEKLLG